MPSGHCRGEIIILFSIMTGKEKQSRMEKNAHAEFGWNTLQVRFESELVSV